MTVATPIIQEPALTSREVRERLRRDRDRLREHYAAHALPQPIIMALHPSYQCIWFYRWSAYNFQRGRRVLARLLWHVNLLLTGADISSISDIGAGVVILHPFSAQIFGRIGENCTFWGCSGIGGGLSTKDIGAGPGLPIVGNNVTFGARTSVLGPVRIGDDCVLEAGVIVTFDVPRGATIDVAADQNRIVRGASRWREAAQGS